MLSIKDHQGNTALHLAVMEGVPESVQLLLQAGANINTPGLLSPLVLMLKQACCSGAVSHRSHGHAAHVVTCGFPT